MATEAQLNANRQNAQQSTGPKTDAGKRRASQNAVTHGLTAARVVIASEDMRRFKRFASGMLRDLAPVGRIEALLADRIVALTWRLYRAEWMETGAINVLHNHGKPREPKGHYVYTRQITDELRKAVRDRSHHQFLRTCQMVDYLDKVLPEVRASLPPVEDQLGKMAVDDFGKSDVLQRMLRYQTEIERSLYKAMLQLERLQYIRRNSSHTIDADPQPKPRRAKTKPLTASDAPLAPAETQPLLPAPVPLAHSAGSKLVSSDPTFNQLSPSANNPHPVNPVNPVESEPVDSCQKNETNPILTFS